MYSFDMKNIVPKESLTCLIAKATLDESMLWHRRLGHINFKNINKLVKDNLVRGLPTKCFENDQTCVACLKGKQHRASCKSKVLNPITKPLFMLHMDLFGPTFVSSLMHKKYCLVVTDDYSRIASSFFGDAACGIVRTAKLRNDILMFQQHQGEYVSEAWTRFKDLLQKSAGGKLYDKNAKESWALLEDLALYDNESWNDPRDFAKSVKAISLPQDVPNIYDRRIIELENQVQRLMEAHLAPKQPVKVNNISSSCEICSGPHDTQHCMKNPEQAFVDYASSRTDEAGGKWFTFKPQQNNLGDTYNPS
ncbi:MAK10-like protein [Tanacetum coccineum]